MVKYSKEEQRELAKLLFEEGVLSKQEIAKEVGISYNTILKWYKLEKLDKNKITNEITDIQDEESQPSGLNDFELTSKQKKEWAETLFIKEDLTQKEIAKRVGVSEQTLSKWVNIEQWEKRRFITRVIRVQNVESLQRQLIALNESIESRAKGERFPSSKEMDASIKLSKAIKMLDDRVAIYEITEVFKLYHNWLRAVDLEESKRQIPYHDQFVKIQMTKK